MKLIVQIPCLNEAETLPATLAEIPRHIEGIDAVEILVIDDGSVDGTAEVAHRYGVDHVVRSSKSRGLAASFKTGIDTALALGADVIVNTDADNQYPGADIPRLVAPILRREADIVIGDRQVSDVAHFSTSKKRLQSLGSWVVRQVSGTKVPDTTSGFRAFSRNAAQRLNLVSDYTYTLETIIQAGKKRLSIAQVSIEPRTTRPSRLIRNNWDYVKRSAATIVRIYAMYEPLKIFSYIGAVFLSVGAVPALRYLYFWWIGEGQGHVQSVIAAGWFLTIGFMILLIGLVADIMASVRRLLEEVLYRQRLLEDRLDELEAGGPDEVEDRPDEMESAGSRAREGSKR
ncbi:MAG TPA: glycosyltransferase family 2 protein [Vicinamibacteria bacterium]|nr:glycosyltransferase family 2 protein [Vicinamibacteria bacterium]